MDRYRRWVAAALGLLAAASPWRPEAAAGQGEVPVLLELFTSEGCSSCPPAETVTARLLREQPVHGARVVLLARHVTYFDSPGWKDRFGSDAETTRQESYAARLGREGPYTPQAVVDGAEEAVGSDEGALIHLVAEAARHPKGELRVHAEPDGSVSLDARWQPDKRAEIWAVAILPEAESQVTGGENAGRHLVHASVVVGEYKLGAARGSFSTKFPRPHSPKGPVEIVAFVQEVDLGRVLAVGWERP